MIRSLFILAAVWCEAKANEYDVPDPVILNTVGAQRREFADGLRRMAAAFRGGEQPVYQTRKPPPD